MDWDVLCENYATPGSWGGGGVEAREWAVYICLRVDLKVSGFFILIEIVQLASAGWSPVL